MKVTWTLVVLGLTAVLSASVPKGKKYKIADSAFLEKQYKVLTLFKHIQQPSYLEEHVQIYQNVVDPVQWLQLFRDYFEKPEVVDTIIEYFLYNYVLPKDVPFSIIYEEQLEQAMQLFKLLYYAKDFETFYTTAVVMRNYFNQPLYLYSLSVAIVHREDCYGITLPPIYEIYPWYFFDAQVIQDAYKYKMMFGHLQKNGNGNKWYSIVANYSGSYLNLYPEQSISYYIEDVGIDSFFYYFNLLYPLWMDGEEFNLKNKTRGEIIISNLRDMIARYYLERLSNGQGEIPDYDWEVPFEVPYYPSLQYPNGLGFPGRPKFANLHEYADSYSSVREFERRLSDAIDAGVVWDLKQQKMVSLYQTKDAINQFGNLLQANADSPNSQYYSDYPRSAIHVLGYSPKPLSWRETLPSAFDHTATASRDPAFYMFCKKFISFYHKFQSHMDPHKRDELVFPGVTIEKVEMDRLVTYFDKFYSDLSNALWDNDEELKNDDFQVWAVQKRFNHKPFNYNIYVNSNHDTQAMVKIYIGPRYDEYGRSMNISKNRWNFVPLDTFPWELKSGQNIIKRSSQDSTMYSSDLISYKELFSKVMRAYNGQEEFIIDGQQNYYYWPNRFMLPKGSKGGTPYQFYFIVYPYKPYEGQKEDTKYPRPATGRGYIDSYPIDYPFDRPIEFEKMFTEIPNSYFYETRIYEKLEDEVCQVQQ